MIHAFDITHAHLQEAANLKRRQRRTDWASAVLRYWDQYGYYYESLWPKRTTGCTRTALTSDYGESVTSFTH
eukprot:scaffold428160_cov45-Prasinocladus_malaysianus.AAC.1